MERNKIQQVFDFSWKDFSSHFQPSFVQQKAASSILLCKSGKLGYNISICQDCGFSDIHANSCRNRNCPCCQAISKELWIDERRSEVIDSPYFHAVFTVPVQLNALIFANQKLLYTLLHKSASETILELSRDKKFLGATPGIIQVLHTWGQELNFHPHIHCIISGGGLTSDGKLKISGKDFFLPVKVMANKFRGKFLAYLQSFYDGEKLIFSQSCIELRNHYTWNEFKDLLYKTQWCPYIKETFNGFGNAIDYLGRYTHRIAISNARILEVNDSQVTFRAKDYKTGNKKSVTLDNVEFIRRFMMHVLPSGFQKIRYYGFLNNRSKQKNLKIIFKIQGHQKFTQRFVNLSIPELVKELWNRDICVCPQCNSHNMKYMGKSYSLRI